ncbi:hypothetical protein TruAng_011651 [Truncatella angustata]|nr:hypothetical protein TruAng_011651 [Truncatella angustata]
MLDHSGRTTCIPNAVDLDEKNAEIIYDMIELFKRAWANPNTREKVLQHQLDAIKRRAEKLAQEEEKAKDNDKDPSNYNFNFNFKLATDAALSHYGELKSKVESGDLKFENFEYGLHLRPENSADYLHLHIIAAPYKYRKYSTSHHDEKTKDAREVHEVILETPARVLAQIAKPGKADQRRNFQQK